MEACPRRMGLFALQIVWVAICLHVQESIGLGVKPFCLRLGTQVSLAMQREQSMTGVAGVFDNF